MRVFVALLMAVSCAATTAAGHARHLVALTMYVTLDRVAGPNAEHGKVGDVDRIRLTYDPGAVDPATQRVPLVNFQHRQNGKWMPAHPDPVMMPVGDSWLDLAQKPYRLHFKASVVHGDAIIIDVDETTRRLTIHPQSDPTAVVISGAYWIDTNPAR